MKGRKRERRREIIAVFLAMVMLVTGVSVYAMPMQQDDVLQQDSSQTTTGLCEHHAEHDDTCGYREGQEGSTCTHVHDDSCYNDGQLNCQHIHDSSCGYAEAVEESPCTYVCEICNGAANTAETEGEINTEALRVLSWSWSGGEDDLIVWSAENSRWEIGMPGANEDNLLTADILQEMLPNEILAEMEVAEAASTDTTPTPEATSTPDVTPTLDATPTTEVTSTPEATSTVEVMSTPGASTDTTPTPEATSTPDVTSTPDPSPALDVVEVSASQTEVLTGSAQSAETTVSSESLPVQWNLDALPEEGAYQGEYTITAALPEGYELASVSPAEEQTSEEGAKEIAVALILGDGTNYAIDPDVLKQHEVTSAPADNVTINLFDYWNTPQREHGVVYPKMEDLYYFTYDYGYTGYAVQDKIGVPHDGGINEGHALLFNGGGLGYDAGGTVNVWDSSFVREGLVGNRLVNGYPQLDLVGQNYQQIGKDNANQLDGNWQTESLAYLFDPDVDEVGKQSFPDVTGLLSYDNEGYHVYNSQEYFAALNEDTRQITLYDTPAVQSSGSTDLQGQFFPFNTADDVYELDGNNKLATKKNPASRYMESDAKTDKLNSRQHPLNHYFGMTMEVEFQQPSGGMVGNGSNPKQMVFEFSGDDDVWIFIDDVLISDVGGLHDAISTEINFATGEIKVNKETRQESLGQLLGDGSSATLETGSVHTLKMFYLERGNSDSNLLLKFNLQERRDNSLKKVDQDGEPISGVDFQLWRQREEASSEGEESYDINDFELIGTGTTGSDGMMLLENNEGTETGEPLVFYTQLNGDIDVRDHFILKETSIPNGYIGTGDGKGEVHLYYDGRQLRVAQKSQWTTGATTALNATVSTSGDIIRNDKSIIGQSEGKKGLIVAVPLYNPTADNPSGNEAGWEPIYGSVDEGFYTLENTSESQRRQILRALYRQFTGADYEQWAVAWDETESQFIGTLENLPGTNDRYIFVNPEGGDTLLAYYFIPDVDGNGVEEKVESLKATIRGYTVEEFINNYDNNNDFGLLDLNQFAREFSSEIQVPNMVRELQVIKTNEDGAALQGATFTLYSDESCNTIVASGTTDASGILSFSASAHRMSDPSAIEQNGHVRYALTPGEAGPRTLYLKETIAPDGYVVNEEVVKVVVTSDSVYAYAGAEGKEDGITVRKGLGKLMQNMVRYASDDDIDTTLRDIIMTGYLRTAADFDNFTDSGGNPLWSVLDPNGTVYLEYGQQNEGTDENWGYGYVAVNGGKPYLESEYGWLGFGAKQNYNETTGDGTNAVSSVHKTNLTDINIAPTGVTNLFTGATAVIVRDNEEKAELSITKTVKGSMGDVTKLFAFTLALKNADGTDCTNSLTIVEKNASEITGTTLSATDSVYTFSLKSGETVKLEVPIGSTYTLTETMEDYEASILVGGQAVDESNIEKTDTTRGTSGTLNVGLTNVTFVNTKGYQPPMGLDSDNMPWLMLLGAAFLTAGYFGVTSHLNRRRRNY